MGRKGFKLDKLVRALKEHAASSFGDMPASPTLVEQAFTRAGPVGAGIYAAGSTFNWLATKQDVARFQQFGTMGFHSSQNKLQEYHKWLPVLAAAPIIVICGGDDELRDARCWEDVIGDENVKKLDAKKRDLCAEYGMLLQDVAAYCTPVKVRGDDAVILQNCRGDYYAFVITATSPAKPTNESPNDKYTVNIVHAIQVHPVE
ncbi:hypothetical protein RSOLAG22IIIB_05834 [Rhizoctonia solani]|uniref:Uncharacterized protein n=1 Tax=Rhizoctonia solani TaxID=456999 RepID=A0A0K6GA00_9AGAM|nr:hypothetical protein RSOLAG22IIIB_05834 [Rhizoctonia solani]